MAIAWNANQVVFTGCSAASLIVGRLRLVPDANADCLPPIFAYPVQGVSAGAERRP